MSAAAIPREDASSLCGLSKMVARYDLETHLRPNTCSGEYGDKRINVLLRGCVNLGLSDSILGFARMNSPKAFSKRRISKSIRGDGINTCANSASSSISSTFLDE